MTILLNINNNFIWSLIIELLAFLQELTEFKSGNLSSTPTSVVKYMSVSNLIFYTLYHVILEKILFVPILFKASKNGHLHVFPSARYGAGMVRLG